MEIQDHTLASKDEIIRIAQLEPTARSLEDANALCDYLLQQLGLHAGAITQVREDLEFIKGVMVGEAHKKLNTSKLVGFDTPKLKVH